MQEKKDNVLVIDQGKKHWFEKFLTAVFLSIACFAALKLLYGIVFLNAHFMAEGYFDTCYYGAPALAAGLRFGTSKVVVIDIEKEKLVSHFHIGPVSWQRLSDVPALEYVSVFYNEEREFYQANLWYKGNRHYKLFVFDQAEEALSFGLMVARRLKTDLLDATNHKDKKWIPTA